MDKRLKEITILMGEYASSRFDKQLRLSAQRDDIDAISNGINMLGEELKAVTISRNYFNNIFNSVSDMVFILDAKGIILEVNKAAAKHLRYTVNELMGQKMTEILDGTVAWVTKIMTALKVDNSWASTACSLVPKDGALVPVHLQASSFTNEQKQLCYVLTAADISMQVQYQNRMIRAIVDTQEKERQRLAKDMHDGLTQQLIGMKLIISTAVSNRNAATHKTNLHKVNLALSAAINDMRNICFNLMPRTLEEFGLAKAVKEYWSHLPYGDTVSLSVEQLNKWPALSPELQIDLYRIIQEFITNAIGHGKASAIAIILAGNKTLLQLSLTDNGKGFNTSKPMKGMGLQNVQSRVKSHCGQLLISSAPGKGTSYNISVPLN